MAVPDQTVVISNLYPSLYMIPDKMELKKQVCNLYLYMHPQNCPQMNPHTDHIHWQKKPLIWKWQRDAAQHQKNLSEFHINLGLK